jgi:hypothetical protein
MRSWPGVRVAAVLIKLVLLDELRRHELVDEVHVVVTRRTSKIFLAAQAQALVPALLLPEVFALLVFLAETYPLFQRSSMSRNSSMPILYGIEIPRRHVNRCRCDEVGVVDHFRLAWTKCLVISVECQ